MAANPTIQLGTDGNWAIKEDNLLAYKKDGDRFFNKEFDFTRGSTATYVDKDGLIKTATSDIPRIDFLNNTKGHLLLEPSRQNRVTNSSEFGDVIINTTITRNQITATDGTLTADRILDNSVNGEHLLGQNLTGLIVNGTTYVLSAFFKSDGTGGKGVLRFYTGSFQYAVFNLENGTVSFTSTGTSKIENYGNGWFRCSLAVTATSDYPSSVVQIGIGNSLNQFSYQGATSLGNYFWGVQFEEGSYATSYIPTQGSAVTRSAETLVQDNMLTSLFNRQGMAFYLEVEALANDSATKSLTINDGSGSDRFVIQLTSNQISTFTISSLGTTGFSIAAPNTDTTQTNKVAASFNASNGYLYINGTQINVDTISNVIGDNLSKISFGNHSLTNNIFYGKIKDYKIYNTALTPTELIALTS